MVGTCKKFTFTFVPVVSQSNNVSNNEIMTIMNIEIVTYPLVLKNVKRINFEGLCYTDDKAPPRYSKFYLWCSDTRKNEVWGMGHPTVRK